MQSYNGEHIDEKRKQFYGLVNFYTIDYKRGVVDEN